MASFLVCAISNKPAEVPVVSKKSGIVFEKSTIEKYIDINGKCPKTGEKLENSDLIEIRRSHFITRIGWIRIAASIRKTLDT